jgi:N4-gp56 family major capsid protein
MSKEIRYAAVEQFEIAQFARKEPGFGRKKGDTINITKIKNIAVPDSAYLDEHTDIPVDEITMGTVGITARELGRAVQYTSLAQDFARFDVEIPVQKRLRDQLAAVNDSLAGTAFKETYVRAVPTSATGVTFDTPAFADVATDNINVTHCGAIRDQMRSVYKIPFYEAGNYIGLGSTKLLRGIKNDPDFQNWRYWLKPGDVLFKSEVGTVEQIRWIEITNTDVLSGSAGAASVLGEGLVFGEDGVAIAEVVTPELRAAIPGGYGRWKGMAWYGVLGYQLIWNETSTAGEVRVLYITGEAS